MATSRAGWTARVRNIARGAARLLTPGAGVDAAQGDGGSVPAIVVGSGASAGGSLQPVPAETAGSGVDGTANVAGAQGASRRPASLIPPPRENEAAEGARAQEGRASAGGSRTG